MKLKISTLITIEGLDGSGKATQSTMLVSYLENKMIRAKKITFPCYESETGAIIKQYLSNKFNFDENIYAISSLYALDRYFSYNRSWKANFERGEVIVSDRYVESNLIHQASKLNEIERDGFEHYLVDYEYKKLALPKPDLVIYLDVMPRLSRHLLLNRYENDKKELDKHESDLEYLDNCRAYSLELAQRLRWHVIKCFVVDECGYRMLSSEKIHSMIVEKVEELLEKKARKC